MNVDLSTLMNLRKKLFIYIEKALEDDPACKSYEGSFSVTYSLPNYFEDARKEWWNIHLDCYVIGPARHYDWCGETLEEAVKKAENEINSWIEDWEEEN